MVCQAAWPGFGRLLLPGLFTCYVPSPDPCMLASSPPSAHLKSLRTPGTSPRTRSPISRFFTLLRPNLPGVHMNPSNLKTLQNLLNAYLLFIQEMPLMYFPRTENRVYIPVPCSFRTQFVYLFTVISLQCHRYVQFVAARTLCSCLAGIWVNYFLLPYLSPHQTK